MSYATIATGAYDPDLERRVAACLAQEGSLDPTGDWYRINWTFAADPSVAPAYASALAAGIPNPGADESVITDLMILSAVQAIGVPTPSTPP